MHTYSAMRFVEIATNTFATTLLSGRKTGKSIIRIQIRHHNYQKLDYLIYRNFTDLIILQFLLYKINYWRD